jgi:PilZ domain-containing protein
MERRRHQRHELAAPVRYEWELPDGTVRQATGITRDFSAGGLFVIGDDFPPVGTQVEFEVDLEASSLFSAVNVRAKGLVNRVEAPDAAGGVGGFAISARQMRLKKPAPLAS